MSVFAQTNCVDRWTPFSTCDTPDITAYIIEIRDDQGGVLETLTEASTSSTTTGTSVNVTTPINEILVDLTTLLVPIEVCLVSVTDACNTETVEQCYSHEPIPSCDNLKLTCEDIAGGLSVIPTGGAAPYTYSWSNGATTQDITGIAEGDYMIVVTDANGCVQSTMCTYEITCTFGLTTTRSTDINCDEATYSFTPQFTGGSAPFTTTYDLFDSQGVLIVGNQPILTTTPPLESFETLADMGEPYKEYKVVITSIDANGCQAINVYHLMPTRFAIAACANSVVNTECGAQGPGVTTEQNSDWNDLTNSDSNWLISVNRFKGGCGGAGVPGALWGDLWIRFNLQCAGLLTNESITLEYFDGANWVTDTTLSNPSGAGVGWYYATGEIGNQSGYAGGSLIRFNVSYTCDGVPYNFTHAFPALN